MQAQSYYVPVSGPAAAPVEGITATRFFRACPNNDGGSSLPNNARIRVHLESAPGVFLVGVPATDIYLLFNRGTAAQGFTGTGADSIIANVTYNPAHAVAGGGTFPCPDVDRIIADAPTDAFGDTYITFGGSDPAVPGQFLRDPLRKWGHYDSSIPVIAQGIPLLGRTSAIDPPGSYTLRIKNYDWHPVAGLNTTLNVGETVSLVDINSITPTGASPPGTLWWKDFDSSGAVNLPDTNAIRAHASHNCGQGCNSVTGLGCLNTSGGPMLDPHP